MRYVNKDQLRRDLPLAYACEAKGIRFTNDGVAHCPFHDDDTPSFSLYEADDGVERWHCFPCGIGGDVYDLLQRLEGIGFPDSINRAEEIYDAMPPGWQANFQIATSREAPTDGWASLLDQARRNALLPENVGMLCVISGMLPPEATDATRRWADSILRDYWGWGVDSDGNMVIPHWDSEGQVTAIKMRSISGLKWGQQGSTYRELYGSWMSRRYKRVLVCEGESDAVWASMQRPHLDIRALPAGASTIKDRYIEQLQEWDTVYLVPDPDDAGINGTRQIIQRMGPLRVRVCLLPWKQDLRDARPDLETLIDEAVLPQSTAATNISIVSDAFTRQNAQGQQRQITGWCFEPKARLVAGDDDETLENAFEVAVRWAGQVETRLISTTDLKSSTKLKEWCGRHGYDMMATDADVAALSSWTSARAVILPEVFQTSRLGIHEAPAKYRYAGRSLVLPDSYVGKLPWKFVSREGRSGHVNLSDEGPIDWTWLLDILRLNDPAVMHPILAWFVATIRRVELKDFPLLFIGGSSGSGKSTIAQLLCRMMGSELVLQLGGSTAWPLTRMLGTTTTIPCFIDEWTRQSREDTRQVLKMSIPYIYEAGVAPRGRQDLSIVENKCSSPIVIAGEDTFTLTREHDRMIQVAVTRTGQDFEALARVGSAPLARVGYWYNRWALEADLPQLDVDRYSNRPEYNRAVLRLGWDTLRQFMEDASHVNPQVPDLPDLDLSLLDLADEAHENEYDSALRAAMGLFDGSGIELVWSDQEGNGTWVRFPSLASQQIMNRIDIRLPGGAEAMKAHFKGQGYNLVNQRVLLPFANRVMYATLIEGYHIQEEQ